jgi:hypothetical protein
LGVRNVESLQYKIKILEGLGGFTSLIFVCYVSRHLISDVTTVALSVSSAITTSRLSQSSSPESAQDQPSDKYAALPLTPSYRLELALTLMSEPDEFDFFNDLSARLERNDPTGREFISLLVSAIDRPNDASSNAVMEGRITKLFTNSKVCPEVTELALTILDLYQDDEPFAATSSAEELVIETLTYLSRAEPTLTTRNRESIFSLAKDCFLPVGELQDGIPDYSELHEFPNEQFDLVGTGCILLLGRFSPDDIKVFESSRHYSLTREAVRFSHDFPISSNLWISALASCHPESLAHLREKQGLFLNSSEAVLLLKRTARDGIALAFVLPPIIRSLWNLMNAGPLKATQSFLASGIAALTISAWKFCGAYMNAVKQNKLSKPHREQLDVVLGGGSTDHFSIKNSYYVDP